MISVRTFTTSQQPNVSIVVPTCEDRLPAVVTMTEYLRQVIPVAIEYLAGVQTLDEPFDYASCIQAAGNAATCECIVFSSTGSYPTPVIVQDTVRLLTAQSDLLVIAMRVDGSQDGNTWTPNPYAAGDWFAMTRSMFERSGGWDSDIGYPGYAEFNYMAKLIVRHSASVAVLEDRMWHPWHPTVPSKVYRAGNAANVAKSMERGLPYVRWTWPESVSLVWPDREEPIHFGGMV
jgi:hypothetical protein